MIKNKALKISIRILLLFIISVLIILSIFVLIERITFFEFYKKSERLEKIPGLWEGYTPQGYSVVDGENYRLVCGYMKNGEASRIYVMYNNGETKYAEMKKADGTDHTGHTGGIAVYGKYVYIAATTGCDLFLLEDILDGDGVATQADTVTTINDPAYCVIRDGMLYAGSFSRNGSHKNPAIITAYRLDPETQKTVSDIPNYVYSTPLLAQGMTFTDDGRMIISASYGLAKSHLYVYDLNAAQTDSKGFDVNGTKIPLIYLNDTCLSNDIIAPPMAEEIIYQDGVVYIMNESASMKYVFGKLTSGNYVYGYRLD